MTADHEPEAAGMQPTHDRHPSDEQLFDYTNGTLERAQAQLVAQHVTACASCAASVGAAQAAVPWARGAGEQLPDAASERMHAALAAEFDARAEMWSGAAARRRTGAPQAGGWRRWLVPAVAFGLLAALAGVSIAGLGDERASGGGVPPAKEAVPSEAGDAARADDELAAAPVGTETATADSESALGAQGSAAPATDDNAGRGTVTDEGLADGQEKAASGTDNGALPNPGAPPPDPSAIPGVNGGATPTASGGGAPVDGGDDGNGNAPTGADTACAEAGDVCGEEPLPAAGAAEEVCAFSFDGSIPELPGGRIPTTVTRGPFGIVVACG